MESINKEVENIMKNQININENYYEECCLIKTYDTCETLEDSFNNLIITIDNEFSAELTPTNNWKISAKYELTDTEVLNMCKLLFYPHYVKIDRIGRNWNDDGPLFNLYINHRVNFTKICDLFENHSCLIVEQRGFVSDEEVFFWRNYVLEKYPDIYCRINWDDDINYSNDNDYNDNDETEDFYYHNDYNDLNNLTENNSNESILLTTDELNEIIFSSNNTSNIQTDNNLNNINNELLCNICYLNRFDHAIIPCGHTLCKNCSEKILEICPTCRGTIKNIFKIYY